MPVAMKKIKILITITLISLVSISCTQKKTGPLVYKGKQGQPYSDPYASSEEYNNIYAFEIFQGEGKENRRCYDYSFENQNITPSDHNTICQRSSYPY